MGATPLNAPENCLLILNTSRVRFDKIPFKLSIATDGDNFRHDGHGDFLGGLGPDIQSDGRMNPVQEILFDPFFQQFGIDLGFLGTTADHPQVSRR